MTEPNRVKKAIITAVILLAGLFLLYTLYDNLHFRLKNTSPSLDKVATSTVEIKYRFSQPVKSVESVVVNSKNITSNVSIENRTVTIPFDSILDSNTEYTITLTGVQSEWFSNQINSIERTFTPEYVDFNNLSNEEKEAQINASHSGQVDDELLSENVFPIFNERWQLEANVIPSDRVVILTVKFFDEVPDYDNNESVKQVPNETAEQYRKEVLEEIKKRGGDPADYTIIYETNKYLYDKYSQSSHYHN